MPAGSFSGALQPNNAQTFAQAVSALGLSAQDKTAIEGVISSQAVSSGCGGGTNPTDAAWIKRTVALKANTTYRMAWNYIGTDYVPFNDGSITSLVYAPNQAGTPTITVNNQVQNYALLGFTNPGTGDYSTGSYGSTGWQYATYQVSISGTYVLGFASFNIGDTSLSPMLLLDDSLGTVYRNNEIFGAVVPNNPNAPVTTTNTAPGSPSITSVVAGSGQLQVTFTAPASDGGAAITNYKYSTDGTNYIALNPAATTSPITIQFLSSGNGTTPLTNGTTYPITLKAVNSVGDSAPSSAVNGTPVASLTSSTPERRARETTPPVVAPQLPGTFRIATPPTNFTNTAPPPVQGPVNRGPQTSPPTNPLATVNGVATPARTEPVGTTGVRITTGTLDFGVRVPNETQGRITQNQSGVPELSVVRNQSTIFSGQGVLPGSTVQVFMSFGPNQSAELARIPVDANGTFNGQAALQTPGSNTPLPIGRHVLQVVSVDQNGNRTVVDMPINVAQPNPQPEILLTNGQTPTLPPGQSLATRAGEPVNVNIIPVPDNKQAIIDGGDWTMSIIAEGDGSNLTETEDGRVLVEFIRDEAANVSGSGFLPDTRADVWLFSEPTLLGTVDIDENGEFNGSINVDGRVVAVGEHTLQLQGVGEDGYVRAANLGVIVNDADGANATTESMSLTWLWWLLALLAVMTLAVAYWYWRRQQEAKG